MSVLVEKVNDCKISFVKICQLDAEDFEYGRKMKSGGDHPRGVRPGVGGLRRTAAAAFTPRSKLTCIPHH